MFFEWFCFANRPFRIYMYKYMYRACLRTLTMLTTSLSMSMRSNKKRKANTLLVTTFLQETVLGEPAASANNNNI